MRQFVRSEVLPPPKLQAGVNVQPVTLMLAQRFVMYESRPLVN